MCARRGSKGAPSPPCTVPAFYFFGSGAFLHAADFRRIIPKGMPRAKPGLTHRCSKAKQPQQRRTPGDAATRTTARPQEPQRSSTSAFPNRSGWFGGNAAKRVQIITESISRRRARVPGVPARQRGCLSPKCWVPKELQLGPRCAQGSLQTLSPALTCFWVPFFLPLESLRISCLRKPQKLLESNSVAPGFSSKPG